MVDRRSFLKQTVAVPILAPVTLALAQDRVSPIGLQLYTVRAELQKDFERTLAGVAAIGYKEVELAYVGEFARGFGRSPQQIRKGLQDNGLTAVSAHVVFEPLGERWDESVDAARTIGQKYLVVNSVDRVSRTQPGIWQRTAERLNRAGEVCRAAGLQLGYHNHLFEFSSIEGTSQRPVRHPIGIDQPFAGEHADGPVLGHRGWARPRDLSWATPRMILVGPRQRPEATASVDGTDQTGHIVRRVKSGSHRCRARSHRVAHTPGALLVGWNSSLFRRTRFAVCAIR